MWKAAEMITLYASKTCPKCHMLAAKMKQKNIEFTEIDDADSGNYEGVSSLPTLDVDGTKLAFAAANTWVNTQEARK